MPSKMVIDGSISVDVTAVPPELADPARAAAGGDEATARAMVLDGALDGALAGGNRELSSQLALVHQWVGTTVGVFAENAVTCPA